MKKLLFLSIIGLSLTNCTNKITTYQLKDYEAVKGVKIGMPLNAAIKNAEKKYYVKKSEIPLWEGEEKEFEYIVFKDKSEKTALYSFNSGYDNQTKDNVFRIVLKNSEFKTVEGISVGMTVKELKEKTKLKSADFNFQDGLFLISDIFDGGFLIDISPIKNTTYNYQEPKISTIPDDLKIKAIIFF